MGKEIQLLLASCIPICYIIEAWNIDIHVDMLSQVADMSNKWYNIIITVLSDFTRVRVSTNKNRKKRGLPSQSGRSRTGKYWDGAWAGAHTNHRHPLYGQGRRAMESPHGPQTQVCEGICAIKVSMSCSNVGARFITEQEVRTDHVCPIWMQNKSVGALIQFIQFLLTLV